MMYLFERYPTSDTTFLTPNSRLSAALLKKHHQWQIAQHQTCWNSLDILPFASWLQRLWQQYISENIADHPMLLTTNQEQLIWEEILSQSPESEFLLQLSSTAELAKSAWRTLKEWRVDVNQSALSMTEDGLIFQQWATQFQTRCQEQNWLDSSSLADFLAQKLLDGDASPPTHLVLIGFTEISPQHQYFLQICEQLGSRIIHNEVPPQDNTVHRISLVDDKCEITTMARWAKAIYTNHPNQSVGCVVPDLKKLRHQVIQIFSEVFSEENTYTLDHTALPFNISAGKKLSDYPIISTALQLLNLSKATVPIGVISSVLRSPFLGEAEQEMQRRAQYENFLRRNNVISASFKQLVEDHDLAKHCPKLAKRLASCHSREGGNPFSMDPRLRGDDTNTRLPSAWVVEFMQYLTQMGWPGERSLNSHEYQVVKNAWLKLLEEFASYDHTLGLLNDQKALHYLVYLANKEMFQPQSPETAPIHILGALEAADIPFDHLWVMGLDDMTWPASPKPNPFIPPQLQKSLQMPHATAERELIYCQQLTEQFKRSAKQVIFSHGLHRDDAELRVSPIIANLPEITLEALMLTPNQSAAQKIYSSKSLEFIQDNQARAISSDEKIKGGTRIFKLQAACPFKAFAELRLSAQQVESPSLGLRAKDRGEIIHKTMEMIWHALHDKTALEKQSESDLMSLIQDSVEKSLAHIMSASDKKTRYRMLEVQRLQKLIRNWLEKEKDRPYFEVIIQEQERHATIGNIPVTFRMDRIDALENGKQIIIDYKTGKQNSTDSWFGDRPDEPQLPLYCITDPDNIIGILFAQINPEKLKWEGVSEIPLDIESVKTLEKVKQTDATTWKEQVAQWQATLEKLADEFSSGTATVSPKDPVNTCEHCHLHTLCRIHEAAND